MAYVPGLRSDVFVSYAHADDPAWISAFELALEQRLRERLGPSVDLWKDTKKLRFGQDWQDEIEQGIATTAAFLAILSPSYRSSPWCTRERKKFVGLFPSFEEMKAGRVYRLLKIVKTAWENGEHREFLGQLQDITFFAGDGQTADLEYLPGSLEFDARVRHCAAGVAALLTAMRRERERVFVASPAEDCFDDSEQLKRELRELGYDVRPDGLIDSSYSDALVNRELDKSLLAVFLIGAQHDPFVEHQIQLSVECGIPLLFSFSSTADKTHDPKQKMVIERIRQGKALPAKFDLLEGTTARGMIEHALDLLRPKPGAVQTATKNGPVSIYLLFDLTAADDSAFARKLQAQIADRERFNVLTPDASAATPTARMERHRQMLRECDGALLYRNSAPSEWLVQTAPDVLFAEFQLQRPPMRSKAFVVNDPAIMPGLPNVIRRSAQFGISELEPFFVPLRERIAHGA
jgi:hypothetical protein